MSLKLLKADDPRLRKISAPVTTFNGELVELAEEIKRWIQYQCEKAKKPGEGALGAGAPQFGHLVQLFVIWSPTYELTMANPEIVKTSGSRRLAEGCLSLPGRVFIVDRPKVVKIRGFSVEGELISAKAHGQIAQAMMHEIEHLQGILVDNVAIAEVPKEMIRA